MLQFCDLLIPLLFKLPISFTIGEKRLMMQHLLEFLSGLHGGFLRRINGEIDELFPDVTDSLIRWMDHVFLVETVVAELIKEDFACREIMCIVKSIANLINCQKQC